jgi:p-hydroxybenzoate 3-monooxygenase
MQETIRTQVGIVGAGPAGLLLAQLLTKHGVDSVLIGSRTRDYGETRVRADVRIRHCGTSCIRGPRHRLWRKTM